MVSIECYKYEGKNLSLILLVAALFLRVFTEIVVLPDDPSRLLVFHLNPFINSMELRQIHTQGVWTLVQDENGIPGQSIYEYITHTATLTVLGLLNASIWARTKVDRARAHKTQAGRSKNSTSA